MGALGAVCGVCWTVLCGRQWQLDDFRAVRRDDFPCARLPPNLLMGVAGLGLTDGGDFVRSIKSYFTTELDWLCSDLPMVSHLANGGSWGRGRPVGDEHIDTTQQL